MKARVRAVKFAAGACAGEEISGNPLSDRRKAPMEGFAQSNDGSPLSASSTAGWIECAGSAFGVDDLETGAGARTGSVRISDASGDVAEVSVKQEAMEEFSVTTELEPFGPPACATWAEHFEFNPSEVKIDWAAGEHPIRLLIHDGATEEEQAAIYGRLEFSVEYENGDRPNRSDWLSVRTRERSATTARLTISANEGEAARTGEIVWTTAEGATEVTTILQSGTAELAPGAETPGGDVGRAYLSGMRTVVCPAVGGVVDAALPFSGASGVPACPSWIRAESVSEESAFVRSCVYIDVKENKIDDYDASAETDFDLIERAAVITARLRIPSEESGGEDTVVERSVRVVQRTLSMEVRSVALSGGYVKTYVDAEEAHFPLWESSEQTAVVSRTGGGRVTAPATPERVSTDGTSLSWCRTVEDTADFREVRRACGGNELPMKRLVLWEAATWRSRVEEYGRGELWNDRVSVCDAPEGTASTQLYFTAVNGGGDNACWGLIDEGMSGYLYVFSFSQRCAKLQFEPEYESMGDPVSFDVPAGTKPTRVKIPRWADGDGGETVRVVLRDENDASWARVLCSLQTSDANENYLANGNLVLVIPSETDTALEISDAETDTRPTLVLNRGLYYFRNRTRRAAAESGAQESLCAGALPAAAGATEAPRLDFERNPGLSVFRGRNAWSGARIDSPRPEWVIGESGYSPAESGQIFAKSALEFSGIANATCNYGSASRSFVFSRKIVVDPDAGIYDVASVRVRQSAVERRNDAEVEASIAEATFGKGGGSVSVGVVGNASAGQVHGYVEENSLYPVEWCVAGTGAITASANEYASRTAKAVYRGWHGGEAVVAISQEAFSGSTTLGVEFSPREATFAKEGGKLRVWALRRGDSIATMTQKLRLMFGGEYGWMKARVQQIPGQEDSETGPLFLTMVSCIDIEVSENTEDSARRSDVVAGYDNGNAGYVVVRQDGVSSVADDGIGGSLNIEDSRITFGAEETTERTVEVTKSDSGADYGALTAETSAEWLEARMNGATLSVRPKSAATGRRTAWVFVAGENFGFASVFVEQVEAGETPVVTLGGTSAEFGHNGGAATIMVTSDSAAGTLTAETSASWLTAELDSAGTTLTVRAEANAETAVRAGTVTVRGANGGEATLAVVQAGIVVETPDVTVTPVSAAFTAKGGEAEFSVTSDAAAGPLTAETSAAWLTAELDSAGTTLTVRAEANAGAASRAGAVTVRGANGGAATVSLNQYASADGDGIRLIPWSVSDGAAYVLMISTTEGAQTLKIFDADTKEEVASFPCDWPADGLGALRYKSSNDVIWLTHPERPVMWVTRSDAWDASGTHSFTFAFEAYPFKVEPMLDWNVGATRLSLRCAQWESGVSYDVGDIVYDGQDYLFSEVEGIWLDNREGSSWSARYGVRISFGNTSAEAFDVGQYVELSGVTAYVAWRKDGEYMTIAMVNPRGEIVHVSGTSNRCEIEVHVGTNDWASADGTYATTDTVVTEASKVESWAKITGISKTSGFYECISAVSGGENVSLRDATRWRKTFCVGKRLEMVTNDRDFWAQGEEGSEFRNAKWRVGQHFALTAKAYSATSGSWGVGAEGEVSDPMLAFGSVTLKTEGGVWSGRLVLEQSLDDGETWEFLDAIVSENGSSNPKITVDVDELGALVRVRCDRRETATTRQALIPSDGGAVTYKTVENDTGCKWSLTCEGYSDIYVKIVKLISSFLESDGISSTYTGAEVEIISGCPYPVSTTTWAEGAWCLRYGYPRTVTLHEERLCFAGNVKRPATLWCSAINHYDDFRRGTLDTSALSVKPTAHSYGRAAWLASGRQLLLGTTLEEFAVGSRDAVAAMSGSNIVAKSSASFGSADADCVTTREGIFTVLPGRRKIGVLKYDAVEEYTGTEVSQRAETLLESGVVELAHMRAPQETLFALCADGTVAALTYDFSQNVAGWSRLKVLDGVSAMCAVRRGERDVLVMAASSKGEVLLGEIDFGSDVWTDDGGGSYESVCEPMPMPVVSDEAHGTTGKVAQADVYLTAGAAFEYSFDGGKRVHRMVAKGRDGRALELFGRVELGQSGDWADEATVAFSTTYPGPFEIAAVGAEIKVGSQ